VAPGWTELPHVGQVVKLPAGYGCAGGIGDNTAPQLSQNAVPGINAIPQLGQAFTVLERGCGNDGGTGDGGGGGA
jgi:hypothetical protein